MQQGLGELRKLFAIFSVVGKNEEGAWEFPSETSRPVLGGVVPGKYYSLDGYDGLNPRTDRLRNQDLVVEEAARKKERKK